MSRLRGSTSRLLVRKLGNLRLLEVRFKSRPRVEVNRRGDLKMERSSPRLFAVNNGRMRVQNPTSEELVSTQASEFISFRVYTSGR